MKIINKTIIIILILTAIILSFIFYKLTIIDNKNNLLNQLQNNLITTRYLFEEQKRYALSLSILLAEDKELISSFKKRDRKESFVIVNRKINLLKKLQNAQIDVQIHNKNLTTYIRSWDLSIKDVPLESFRQGIVKVHKQKAPFVSIELGKRLNIKAITPLLENNQLIGSIEVIIGFEHLEKELNQKGLEPYILLYSKFLNIADTLKNNIKIKNFVLVNDKNKEVGTLNDRSLDKLEDYGYFTKNDRAFSYFSIYSYDGQKLGYILVSFENKEGIDIKRAYKKNKAIRTNGITIE